MANVRTGGGCRVVSPAPPPTPIATAAGKKSAAVDDKILSQYLAKSLMIPELSLPETRRSHPAAGSDRLNLELVHFMSLLAGDQASIQSMVAAAKDVGAFQIIGHDISAKEIESVMEEADRIFRTRSFRLRNKKKESLVWKRREDETVSEGNGQQNVPTFSDIMEVTFSKLQKVSEELGKIFFKNVKTENSMQKREALLCFHRNYHANYDVNLLATGENDASSHALSLYLVSGSPEFHVQSIQGCKSFTAESGAIIITIGRELQEWSNGEYKSFPWDLNFVPYDGKPSVLLEFMCSPLFVNHESNRVTISITDQLFIALFIVILYKILSFITSEFVEIFF